MTMAKASLKTDAKSSKLERRAVYCSGPLTAAFSNA